MKLYQILQQIFPKKSKRNPEDSSELRQSISLGIENIRFNNLQRDLKLPNDQNALNNFYKLAIFCINSFPLPTSHKQYMEGRLKVRFTSRESLVNNLLFNWDNAKGNFDLEMPLRGIEVIFSFGEFVITDDQASTMYRYLDNLKFALEDKR